MAKAKKVGKQLLNSLKLRLSEARDNASYFTGRGDVGAVEAAAYWTETADNLQASITAWS